MSSRFRSLRSIVLPLLAAALTSPARAQAPGGLRVCADPNNLPFTNRRMEGFENRIADLLARDMRARLSYTWWAQRRGFFRNTLKAGLCDVVLGVPAGFEMAATTRPYYRSTYVFVSRAARNPMPRSLDDEALRTLRIGVQLAGNDYNNPPPAHALSRRGIVDNVVGYSLYGDYSEENPPARIVEAVARGDIDVAIVWGPLAGYFAPRQRVRLTVTPVSPSIDPPSLPFVYDICVGVRRGREDLKKAVQQSLDRRRGNIQKILAEYGVPLLPL